MNRISIALLFFLVASSLQVSFNLENDKVFCIWKDFDAKTINTFSYVVSGRNERNVEVKVIRDYQ